MLQNPPFPATAKPFPNNARATLELLKYVPQMTLRERDRRWDRLRKKMLMAGIDALILLGNDIYWVSLLKISTGLREAGDSHEPAVPSGSWCRFSLP